MDLLWRWGVVLYVFTRYIVDTTEDTNPKRVRVYVSFRPKGTNSVLVTAKRVFSSVVVTHYDRHAGGESITSKVCLLKV